MDLEPDCPPAFGTLNFRTTTGETGNDTGNNLKDFISPIPLDAPSTCGSLSIFKEDADGEPRVARSSRSTRPAAGRCPPAPTWRL